MRRQPLLAWLIYAGLTIPIGLFGHVLFERSGGVRSRTGAIALDHAVIAAIGVLVMGLAIFALRRGARPDRRRRLALWRAALPPGVPLALAGVVLQGSVALATLLSEGISIDPGHLLLAVTVGLAGILLGSFAFHAVEDELFALVAALVADVFACEPAARRDFDEQALANYAFHGLRLRAGRAPPSGSISL